MLNFNYNIRRFDIAATLGWTGRYENMNNMRVSTNGGLVTETGSTSTPAATPPAARCNVWNC